MLFTMNSDLIDMQTLEHTNDIHLITLATYELIGMSHRISLSGDRSFFSIIKKEMHVSRVVCARMSYITTGKVLLSSPDRGAFYLIFADVCT